MESSTPGPGLHKCCGREGGWGEHLLQWFSQTGVVTHCRSGWNPPKFSLKISRKFKSLIPDVSDLQSCSILSETSCMRVWLMLESMTCRMQFRTALAWASTAAALSSTLSRKFLKKKNWCWNLSGFHPDPPPPPPPQSWNHPASPLWDYA